MIEDEQVKILWDFQIQTDKQVMADQPDIVVVDVAISSDGNIRKKEHEKLERRAGKNVDCEGSSGASCDPLLGAVTPELD